MSYGNYSALNFQGAVGAPLGDKAAVRLAVLSDTRGEIYSDPTLGRDVGNKAQQAVRLSFAADPVDYFNIFANFFYGSDHGDGPYYKGAGTRNPDGTACAPTSSNPGGPCVDGSGFRDSAGFDQIFSDIRALQRIEVYGGLLDLKWRFDDMSLTSITSVYRNTFKQMEDPDGGPASLNELHISDDTKQTAEELRLASEHTASAPVNWILGAYFFKETQDGLIAQLTRTVQIQPQPFPPPTWFPPIPQFRSMLYKQNNPIKSGYFQVDWKFTQELELTAGGRFSSEQKNGEASTLRARRGYWLAEAPPIGTFIDAGLARSLANPNPAISSAAPTPFGHTWNNAGGKIGLNWRPARDALYYASISRGFKGGTFNFVPAVDLTGLTSPASPATFQAGVQPEKLTTYEVGSKLEFMNHALRLNFALFRNAYTNQQTVVFQDGGLALINAASSTINGLEAELEWAPGGGWLLQGGLGLLNAKYDKFVLPQGGGDLSGGRIVDASNVSANGLAEKSWEIDAGKLSAQVSFKYFSNYYPVAEFVELAGYPNVSGPFKSYDVRDRIAAQTLIDARLGYAFGAKREYDVALWAHNLSDRRYCATTGELPWGQEQCAPSPPRTYGVQVRVGF